VNIDARELTLVFDAGKDTATTAVDRVDLSVGPGEMLAVMGPSGSGKSSLLYLLSGLRRPSAGSVFYDGQDIRMKGEREMDALRAHCFGFIFQRHYLLSHLTLLENVLLPLQAIGDQDVDRALGWMNELGLWPCRDKTPGQVSVGQRQKAAVLRALIARPQVLFADEPTAALDMDSAMRVMELLVRHKAETSVVVVTHDYRIVKDADRLVRLRDGRLVPPDE
jgi:putative ABC transport system ATP-binding protein